MHTFNAGIYELRLINPLDKQNAELVSITRGTKGFLFNIISVSQFDYLRLLHNFLLYGRFVASVDDAAGV